MQRLISALLFALFAFGANAGLVSVNGAPGATSTTPSGGGTNFAQWDAVSGATDYRLFWDTDSSEPYRYHCDVGNVTSIATRASLPSTCEPLVDGTWAFNITPIDDQGFQGAYTTEQTSKTVSGLKTACNSTLSAGANIGTAISSATAGNIICLNSGSYSGFTLASVVKSPRVRVRSITQNGAITTSGIDFTGNTSGITIDGVRFQAINHLDGAAINNITLRAFTATHGISIQGPTSTTPNLLVEDATWTNVGTDATPGAAIFEVDSAGSTPRIIIRNVTLDGGCADGVQTGSPVQIEDSRFLNRTDVDGCFDANHTDAFQVCCGVDQAAGTILRRNYWYHNIQVLSAFDGVGHLLVENNLFNPGATTWPPCRIGGQIEMYSDTSSTIRYNTSSWWSSTCPGSIVLEKDPAYAGGTGTQIYDNNIGGTIDIGSGTSTSVNARNIVRSGLASNCVGVPTMVGGVHPTTFAEALLSPGSACKGQGLGGIDPGVQFRNLPAVQNFTVNPAI